MKKTVDKCILVCYYIQASSREGRTREYQIIYMERYRSGHNEAVLKTVCPQGRVGSNPTLSVNHEYQHDFNAWRSTQVAEGARLESE